MSVALETKSKLTTTTTALPPGVSLVFKRELRACLKTFLYWFVPVVGLVIMTISLQPSMAQDGGMLAAKLEMLPESLRQAFGVTVLDFTRPANYLATNLIYVTLTGSLLAGILGATLVAREEAQHTAEILLTLPVSRAQVLLGKAGVLAVYALGFHLLMALTSILSFQVVVGGEIEAGLIASLFGGTAALGVCFGGAGMLVATLVREPRSAGSAALGLVFGTYLLGVASGIAPKAEKLGWLSPFQAVEPGQIIANGGLDTVNTTALVLIGVACGAAAIVRYGRKDIHA